MKYITAFLSIVIWMILTVVLTITVVGILVVTSQLWTSIPKRLLSVFDNNQYIEDRQKPKSETNINISVKSNAKQDLALSAHQAPNHSKINSNPYDKKDEIIEFFKNGYCHRDIAKIVFGNDSNASKQKVWRVLRRFYYYKKSDKTTCPAP